MKGLSVPLVRQSSGTSYEQSSLQSSQLGSLPGSNRISPDAAILWNRTRTDTKELIDRAFPHVVVKPALRIRDDMRFQTMGELLFDLIYIFVLQQMFLITWSPTGVAYYVLYFMLAWNGWAGVSFFNTRFDTDDLPARAVALMNMVAVVGMSVGAGRPVETGFGLYVASYMVMRIMLVLQYTRAWCALPGGRQLTGRFIIGFSCGVACWAVFVSLTYAGCTGIPRWLFLALGLLCDYGTPFAVIPWMVSVHGPHITDRFAGWIVLMFTGTLFNFVQTMGHPSKNLFHEYLFCALTGLLLAFLEILLYSYLPGADLEGFEESLTQRFKVYIFLYLHMPLASIITLCSISMGHIQCLTQVALIANCQWDPTLWLQSSMCGATLVMLGVLHLLSANRNSWRAAVRIACGVVLLAVYPAFPRMQCRAVLLTIVSVLSFQVMMDYTVCVQPPRKVLTSSSVEES
uniref:Low temperature requirement protein A n=1 Tax=Noctiluca scintillans TaxID=2966 RepID=A0A7S1B1R9_NOCSC